MARVGARGVRFLLRGREAPPLDHRLALARPRGRCDNPASWGTVMALRDFVEMFVFGIACVSAGCATPETPVDGGREAGTACAADVDCDDGVFCNGLESCSPTTGTGPRHCAPGAPPCASASACDESSARCSACTTDSDGDGSRAIACGGMDCDDADPSRYPGNEEVCDVAAHDEDCDPTTFGVRDGDGDGAPDQRCCNGTTCGDDCDDTRRGVYPGATEACDAFDNDCDDTIDELVMLSYYLDADNDGYGDPAMSMTACAPPAGYVALGTDCRDDDMGIHPGAMELCNGIDDNCAMGVADEQSCACSTSDPPMVCGTEVGDCTLGTRDCIAGTYGSCSGRGATTEVCATTGVPHDEDCDGHFDEGLTISTCFVDADRDGYGGRTPAGAVCAGPGGSCPSGFAATNTDCDDTLATGANVHPMATETCEAAHIDNDCDGRIDEAGGREAVWTWSQDDGYTQQLVSFWNMSTSITPPRAGAAWQLISSMSPQAMRLYDTPTPIERLNYGHVSIDGVVQFNDGGMPRSGGFDVAVLRDGPTVAGPVNGLGLPSDAVGWAFRYYDAEPRIALLRRDTTGTWHDMTAWQYLPCRPNGSVRFQVDITATSANHATVTFELHEWITNRCAVSATYDDPNAGNMINQPVRFGLNAGNEASNGLSSLTLPYYTVHRYNACD